MPKNTPAIPANTLIQKAGDVKIIYKIPIIKIISIIIKNFFIRQSYDILVTNWTHSEAKYSFRLKKKYCITLRSEG